VRRLRHIATWCLSFALITGSTAALAAPKKGGGSSKKGAPRAAPSSDKGADPLGDIGSGGSKSLSAPSSAAAPASSGGSPPQRGPTRIDFDDRLIQGQTNKSGAVYLYDRKELQVKSMVKRRESFRQEILSTVYDTQ
jgi:hypothetical protein